MGLLSGTYGVVAKWCMPIPLRGLSSSSSKARQKGPHFETNSSWIHWRSLNTDSHELSYPSRYGSVWKWGIHRYPKSMVILFPMKWPQMGGVPTFSSTHMILVYINDTSSTAQGGGGSFKNRKPIGEVGCCESGMAKRIHWWIERCLISLTLSLSFSAYLPTYLLTYLPTYLSSIYLSIYRSLYLSLFHLITYLVTYLSIYLWIYLSISPSIDLL